MNPLPLPACEPCQQRKPLMRLPMGPSVIQSPTPTMAIRLRSDTRFMPIRSSVDKQADGAFSAINQVRFATTSRLWQPSRIRPSKRFLTLVAPVFTGITSSKTTSRDLPHVVLIDCLHVWIPSYAGFSSSRFPRPRRHQGERCSPGGEISYVQDARSIVSRALHGKRPFGSC